MSDRPNPRRGEVWLVNFEPQIGAEIRKTRPAVVISVDAIGKLPLRLVVPITGRKAHHQEYPWLICLQPNDKNRLTKISSADAFQVKSLSVERFVSRIGVLESDDVEEIAAGIILCVGSSGHAF